MDGALEIAAYCSLTVAMTLLVIRLFWPKLAPKVMVRRFRRRPQGQHAVHGPQQPPVADADLPPAGRHPQEEEPAHRPLQQHRGRVEAYHAASFA